LAAGEFIMEMVTVATLEEAFKWVAKIGYDESTSSAMAESNEAQAFVITCEHLLGLVGKNKKERIALVAGIIATAFQCGRRYGNQELLRGAN
jgi:hypothetical protein